jgi:transcriptional regulator with XRE-family HTH domain
LHGVERVGEVRTRALEQAIGREVRARRKAIGTTLAGMAAAAGTSIGMLSKIENGYVSLSLATLNRIATALGVSITALLRPYCEPCNISFVKAGEGPEVDAKAPVPGITTACSALLKAPPAPPTSCLI